MSDDVKTTSQRPDAAAAGRERAADMVVGPPKTTWP